ncbi:MAG: UDP-N-acetylmuramoyl-tripeptide--D-alanyl-D-alanine ligase [Actinomycetota bacterium]
MKRPLTWIAAACAGRLEGRDTVITGVTVDSRRVTAGDLFVALSGERTDGHDHVEDALSRGAVGALVERQTNASGPQVVVESTRDGLLLLAGAERADRDVAVVGITGSSGKTSTKDLAASVLGSVHRVHASPESYNTEVGVPLTLLQAPEDTDVIVCEMGSRGPGQITELARVARPTVGVVTNVGTSHLEYFGSREAVADAKAELVEALPREGTAVLNADDAVVRTFAERTKAEILRYGFVQDAEVRGEELSLDSMGRASFRVRVGGDGFHLRLSVPGEHMAQNALAAAASGIALGVPPGECAEALANARVSRWRMEIAETSDGVRVVNDAYNANPSSMAAALRTTRWMAEPGRLIAVLGEMAELGPVAEEEHERIGELAARLRIDRLVVVGAWGRRIGVSATREGFEPDRVTMCASVAEAEEAVRELVRPGDVVLVKASRAVGLERVAASLLHPGQETQGTATGAHRSEGTP